VVAAEDPATKAKEDEEHGEQERWRQVSSCKMSLFRLFLGQIAEVQNVRNVCLFHIHIVIKFKGSIMYRLFGSKPIC